MKIHVLLYMVETLKRTLFCCGLGIKGDIERALKGFNAHRKFKYSITSIKQEMKYVTLKYIYMQIIDRQRFSLSQKYKL